MSHSDKALQESHDNLLELEMVFNMSRDEIFLADANGTCVRVNPACERYYGLQGIELIGRNVFDLEKEKIFYPSATAQVIKEMRPVTLIQTTSTGRKLFVTANPVFDSEGKLISVVSNSTDITELLSLKKRVGELERVIEDYNHKFNLDVFESVSSKSLAMRKIIELLSRVAQVDTNVLLLGESGVGKTEIARWIHKISGRSHGPFVEINCGAIPPSLFESELFGYEKGSFSGALSSGRIGLLESANKGTVFLDEIGELPLELQTKLLHVIQSKAFMRVGGREIQNLDIRLITATNQDLESLAKDNKFRKDLYYRLNVVSAKIPPLRERKEDIIDLIFTLLERVNVKYGIRKTLSPHLIEEFLAYDWPGNIRELENMIERLAVTAEGDIIHHNDSFIGVTEVNVTSLPSSGAASFITNLLHNPEAGLDDLLEYVEKEVLTHFMSQLHSSRKVAERLRVSQSTIVRKMQKYKELK